SESNNSVQPGTRPSILPGTGLLANWISVRETASPRYVMALNCCIIPNRSQLTHSSTIFPSSMRSMAMPIQVARLLVGGKPINTPFCVPVDVKRVTTLSPSATWSSIVSWNSGNASRNSRTNVTSADAGGAKLTAETGTFYSAERQTRIGGDHCIDENHAGIQLRYEEFLLLAIIGPCAGAETKCGVVRQLDGIMGVAHPENSCDRAEHFFTIRRRFFGNIDENSWLVEQSGTVDPISAGQ